MNTPSANTLDTSNSTTYIKGYKIFNSDWTCVTGNSNRIFKVGETYDSIIDKIKEENINRFNFFKEAINCLNYLYDAKDDFRFLKFTEVESPDDDYLYIINGDENIVKCRKLKIVREIPIDKFIALFSNRKELFYDNGSIEYRYNYKINYKNKPSALLHGKQEGWYKNGVKNFEKFYEMGHQVGVQKWWYDNGKKMSEYDFNEEGNSGTDWYENGMQMREFDRKYLGTYEEWYKDGIKKCKHIYNEKGEFCRPGELWDEDGNKIDDNV